MPRVFGHPASWVYCCQSSNDDNDYPALYIIRNLHVITQLSGPAGVIDRGCLNVRRNLRQPF